MAPGRLDNGRTQTLPGRLAARLEEDALTTVAAAAAIGVTTGTLRNHLAGEHIRSDSARKYEDWLARRASSPGVFRNRTVVADGATSQSCGPNVHVPPGPSQPRLVVDIFSGCGGMSLGFELLREPGSDRPAHFRTVMALDNQPSAIKVLNDNQPDLQGKRPGVGRLVDITEFLNEAEILAFYLDHVARLHGDMATRTELLAMDGGLIGSCLHWLRAVDAAFLEALRRAMRDQQVRTVVAVMAGMVSRQSTVQQFHERLRLPRFDRSGAVLPTGLWTDNVSSGAAHAADVAADPAEIAVVEAEWNRELLSLEGRGSDSAKGQLSSSGRRIAAFVAAARSDGYRPVRDAWCEWKARHQELRHSTFNKVGLVEKLSALLARTYPVSVLLGGPPCQGFSRIGRGKIRSLHEVNVHSHRDTHAGDTRNRLYVNYVMVVNALRPEVFAFENVPQFQSTVKVGTAEFLATNMLTEAIATMSGDDVAYKVASKTIDASLHGVPQTRQRFIMLGVRADLSRTRPEAAAGCLDLPLKSGVCLGHALDGLPAPHFCTSAQGASGLLAVDSPVGIPQVASGAVADYIKWVRQPRPGCSVPTQATDAHVARVTREDDAQLYELMGPGTRWMDYRTDAAPTLARLRSLLEACAGLSGTAAVLPAGFPSLDELSELSSAVDGSLALRLILEQVGRGETAPHHLLNGAYLSKQSGNHGDWLTRLDARTPCRTVVAHMAKDTYGYVHPSEPRTLSVREAARVQSFPDWFRFGTVSMSEAFRMIGNAVPPALSNHLAAGVAALLHGLDREGRQPDDAVQESSLGAEPSEHTLTGARLTHHPSRRVSIGKVRVTA